MIRILRIAMAAPLLLVSGVAASAAEDVESIVRSLQPKPISRGIGRGIVVEGAAKQPEEPPQISMMINFEVGSSTLTNDGKMSLDALGKAMHDKRLANMRFRLIGHTDSRGGDEYNMGLSQRRADTTKAYLTQFHNIDPATLETEGRGRSQPADPSQPEAAVNRRVQIINITGAATN